MPNKRTTAEQVREAVNAAKTEAMTEAGGFEAVYSYVPTEANRFGNGEALEVAERVQSGGLSDAPRGRPVASEQDGKPFTFR